MGLREDAEKEYDSLELFLAHNFFGNHMGIEDIEVNEGTPHKR